MINPKYVAFAGPTLRAPSVCREAMLVVDGEREGDSRRDTAASGISLSGWTLSQEPPLAQCGK